MMAALKGGVGRESDMSGETDRIAIIGGTGAEGSGIALRLAKAGRRVIIGSRDAAKAEKVAQELNRILGTKLVEGANNKPATLAAAIVIVTVPFAAQKPTIEEIREALAGKILVDATAPLVPPRVNRVQLPAGGSAVAAMQAMLGESVRVVSAFQNVSAEKLKKLDEDVDCDVLICADDAAARQTIIEIVNAIGLRGIDAGPICNSAAAEALTSVLIWINRKYTVPGAGIRITGIKE
jgi:8-hydroxy-5-deazaflavin:NADPH oxidoreductase